MFYAQEELLDLGIDGKDLNKVLWKDSILAIEASLGKSILNQKGKDYEAKVFDLKNAKVLNSFASEKGTEIDHFNTVGNLVLSDPMGVVINPFGGNSSGAKFIGLKGKVLGPADVDDDDVYIDETSRLYLTKDKYIFVAPKKKGYNGGGKTNTENPTQWLISKMDINTQKVSVSSFTPSPIEGRVREVGYTLLYVTDDEVFLLSKQFENTNEGKEPNIQKLKVSTFDMKGTLLKETELKIEIDNTIVFFGKAGLKDGYDMTDTGSYPVRAPKSPATGTVYIDHKNEFYYAMSFLTGLKKKTGMFLYFAKFDFEGNKIWEYRKKFLDKALSVIDTKKSNFEPIILDDQILFRDSIEDLDETLVFGLNASDGKELKFLVYDNLKGNYRRSKNGRGYIGGLYLKKEMPKTVMMRNPTLVLYSFDERIKEYIKSLASETEAVVHSHVTSDGTIYMLQANYADRRYKLLKVSPE